MQPCPKLIPTHNQGYFQSHNTVRDSERSSIAAGARMEGSNLFCTESPEMVNDRQVWSERVLQDVTGLLHVLSPCGKILYCSDSCIKLTGYHPHELTGKSLIDFVHMDDVDVFSRNLQLAFYSMSRIRTHYRLRCKNDTYLLLESIGQPKQNMFDQFPQSFFAIAQPYFSRSNELLDSFLEMKTENKWLKNRINELAISQESYFAVSSSNYLTQDKTPPPPPPHVYDPQIASLSQQRQQIQQTNMSLDSLPLFQKENEGERTNLGYLSKYQCSTSSEPSSMLVSLHSQYGEDSMSPTSNLPPSMLEDIDSKDKWKRRKKHRAMDNHICTDCGTNSSPEWRKGPFGPKTLCNACGLRWAKKYRRHLSMN